MEDRQDTTLAKSSKESLPFEKGAEKLLPCIDSVAENSERTLSKKQLKRKLKFERIRAAKKQKRKIEKSKATITKMLKEVDTISVSKLEKKQQIRKRLEESMISGQRIVIDLSWANTLSEKEQHKLARQLGRVYGSNRAATQPCHLYLTSLSKDSRLWQICTNKNDGFENYIIDMCSKGILEVFSKQELVYLSPDSKNVLGELRTDKVYVIGGIIDETKQKNMTLHKASGSEIYCARLPINEYLMNSYRGTSNKVLAINQVFDILLRYLETSDWAQALIAGIPKRSGFVLKLSPTTTNT